MITHNWHDLLQGSGAQFNPAPANYFQTPAKDAAIAMQDNVIAALSHLSAIAVCGEDASKFLQGQLSCNLQEISAQQSRLGVHCSPKGRIITSFRLLQGQESYYLQLPQQMLSLALANLQKYAIFSKVKLRETTGELYQLGVSGPTIEKVLNQYLPTLPTSVDAVENFQDLLIVRLPGVFNRYQIIGPYEPIKQLWSTLSTQVSPVGTNAWDLLEILAGVAHIYPQTSGLFTPHQINYQLINGVSFKKGCYTGQEIIARMQYLGKLKQHMHRAVIATLAPISLGEKVVCYDGQHSTPIGEVIMTACLPDSQQLLVTLQDSALTKPLFINQVPVSIMDLPYLVPI